MTDTITVLRGLLQEAKGHLEGRPMSQLAYTRSGLCVRIDAALQDSLASEHSKSGTNDAQDALRWRWWRANGMRVEAEGPDDWTCWVGLPCIPFRSKTEDPDELTDALIARFPLQPPKPDSPVVDPRGIVSAATIRLCSRHAFPEPGCPACCAELPPSAGSSENG